MLEINNNPRGRAGMLCFSTNSLKIATLCFLGLITHPVFAQKAKVIKTNAASIYHSPSWLTRNRAEKVILRIERDLEWSIRRINVYWHKTESSFTSQHKLGPAVRAVTLSKDQTVHLGPQVNENNFEQIFAHELVHVISFQKYKGSIPKWLEEGLANHLAKKEKVNYRHLNKQKLPSDIYQMTHAFQGGLAAARVHYATSQAVAEMLAKKCDLMNLVRISLEGDMRIKIKNYCEIEDINKTFRSWVSTQAARENN